MDKLINVKLTMRKLLRECKTDQDRLVLLQELGQFVQQNHQNITDRMNIPHIECVSKSPLKHDVAEVKPEPTIDVTV